MTRPNIIYIFADQLRYDALGCTGNAQAVTPNIDRFAAQSARLTNFVANTPVCTAYRASLMTGKHTTSHGMVINELRMHPNQTCLGHLLGSAGYLSTYIGKWHLFANVFGHHFEPENSFVPRGPHRLGFDGTWKAYNFNHENYSPSAYYHEESPAKIYYPEGVFEATAQTDFAITALQTHEGDQPFAMVLSYGPPHDPWGPDHVPAPYWDMMADKDFPNPPNYRETDDPHADNWARLKPRERASLSAWRRGYHAQVAAAKLIFYEEAAHVPFFIRWPGQVPARDVDCAAGAVDVLPTVCGLLGLSAPRDVEGTDLSPYVLGAQGGPEVSLLMGCGATADWEDGHEWRAARDARWTYATYRVDGSELLFDRDADPFQMVNLAQDPAYGAQKARLRDWMQAEMARINDGFAASTWYREHWTDGDRCIIRSATSDFGPAVATRLAQ